MSFDPYNDFEWLKLDYAEFSEGQKYHVMFQCCFDALQKLKKFGDERDEIFYLEQIAGTTQKLDFQLPFDAFYCAKYQTDSAAVTERYVYPMSALRVGKIGIPANIAAYFFAVHDLFQCQVNGVEIDDFSIILNAVATDDFWGETFPYLRKLVDKVKNYEYIPAKYD